MKPVRLTMVVLALVLIGTLIPVGAFAADPVYQATTKVDNAQGYLEMSDLAPGQVQAGKFVDETDDPLVFTVTLRVQGAVFGAGINGSTYNPLATDVTIVDLVGKQFAAVEPLPAGLDYNPIANTVTWVVSPEAVLEGPAISFDVRLVEGWQTDVWYWTNTRCTATFLPAETNPFYYGSTREFEGMFTTSEMTVEGSAFRYFTAVTINDTFFGPFHLDFATEGATVSIDGRTFTLASGNWTSPNAGVEGQYGVDWVPSGMPGVDKFEIWIKGLDGPGTTTIYAIYHESSTDSWLDGSKFIITAPTGSDFTWENDVVLYELTNNGAVLIEEVKATVPPTGDAVTILEIVGLFSLLGFGGATTRLARKRDH